MDKEARKVQRSITTLGKNMEKTGKAMTKYISLPLLAAGAAVTKFGADFDKAMTSSLAIMGELTEAMKKDMSDAAREVGKTTKFSATEAAEAYFFLASAGLSAKQSIEALPKVAAFAQAGQFDLSLATDLLTDAQSALGLVVKDVAKNMENMVMVSDVLVKANTLANASVQEFSEALTNKAGAALRVLGKEMEEGVAVLAVYADQGVKGAEAGTQLNIVMRDLQKAAIKHKEAFKEANVAVFDQEGEMRNLADIVSDLTGRLENMSDEEKKAELMTLGFTEKSISATVALIGTSDAIREYQTKLEDAAGITDEVSKKQLQNFWDQLGLVKSELIDVALTIWQSLEPVLTKKLIPALKKVAGFIKGVANWFDGLNKATKETFFVIGALVVAFGPFLLIVGKTIIATKALTSSILLMNAALLANPFVLAAVAITAIGTAIYYTSAAWEEWKKNIGDDIAEKQTNALKKNLEDIIPLYGELATASEFAMDTDHYHDVLNKVKEIETNLADLGHEFTGNFGKRVVAAENALTDLLDTFVEGEAVIDRTADAIENETKTEDKAVLTAAKLKRIKAEQIALSKAMIRQLISETDSLKAQESQKLKLLDIEEKEAIAKAEGGKKSIHAIRELYDRKRVQLAKETAAKIKAIEKKLVVDEKKFAQKELGLVEKTRKSINDFYQNALKTRLQQLRDERKNAVAEAERLGADTFAVKAYYAAKERELIQEMVLEKIEYVYQLADIIQGAFNNRLIMIDQETEKQRQAIEESVLSEEDKNKKFAELDEKAAKKKKGILRKQAILEKTMGLFSIGINTAVAIMKGYALLGPIGGTIAAVIIGLLALAQTAVVLSKPIPARKGLFVKGDRGGIQAEVGEGRQDELILPMKTGVQALAEALVNKLSEFKLPEIRAPQFAMAGGGTMTAGNNHRGGDMHLHIGTLIADEAGLKALERRLDPYRISNEQRKGRLSHGSR